MSRTNTVSFPHRVNDGDLIIVAITTFHETVTAVQDAPADQAQPSNTYRRIGQPLIAMPRYSNDLVELWFAAHVSGGARTVTVSFSDPGYYAPDNNVGIYEFSGLNKAMPLVQTTNLVGVGNTPDGGTLANAELYFAVGVDGGPDNVAANTRVTAGAGYTLLDRQDSSDSERFYTEYQIASSGPYHTNFSIPYSSNWGVIGIAIRT